MGFALEPAAVPDVLVTGCDVEVAGQHQLLRGAVLPGVFRVGRQRVQPGQLVAVVRVADFSAVGYVQAPHPHAVADRADSAGFLLLWCVEVLIEAGLAELGLHVLQTHPGQDGDPVEGVQAVVGLLVAGVAEVRELLVRALGFLQAQHVHVGAFQEGSDPVFAGADGVDVPRGDTHR